MRTSNQWTIFMMALFVSSLVLIVSSVPVEDEVTMNIHLNYTHKWYSGYLNFSKSKYHYVFFDSQHDPDNDPLILWLNGGPGCSSLIGMVTQNGPFVFEPNTTTLVLNKYAWNNKANLLYIQSPGGVGFSHGERQGYDDETTAEDNLRALLAFFQKFPNMKKNDFYITGESYAGIYVPYLAYKIINHNKLPSQRERIIRLKGIMVGNACTHWKQCYEATADGNSIYFYEFLYHHAFINERQYVDLKSACSMDFNAPHCKEHRQFLDKKFAETNSSILNIYAPCYYNSPSLKSQRIHRSKFMANDDMDCQDSIGIDHFFNMDNVFVQLHVDHVHWQQCSQHVATNYKSFPNASYWIYPHLQKQGLRLWIYSGDVDADVPITGTLKWLSLYREEFGVPVEEPWREWWVYGAHAHEDQVGGMVWGLKGITFVSVRGAGHMVPKDKPQAAYVLIQSFVGGHKMPYKIK